MSDEFEDRENETLGELPQSIQTERGEFSQHNADNNPLPGNQGGGVAPPQPTIPPDIVKQAEALQEGRGKLGSPVIPASVTSVYDARPINGRDWMLTEYQLVQNPNGGAGNQTLTLQYVVPPGFTGVLRRFAFEPSIFGAFTDTEKRAGTEWDGVLVSLKVQGINVPDYQNLMLGQSADILMDAFVLAGEGQTLELVLKYSSAMITKMGDDTAVLMRMYGNNLLTRGLPTPFEIATQIKSGTDAAS
jgi:hypothetical protein